MSRINIKKLPNSGVFFGLKVYWANKLYFEVFYLFTKFRTNFFNFSDTLAFSIIPLVSKVLSLITEAQ